MSFNLASLIAGPSKSKTESLMKTENTKKTENKKEAKKSFMHGINVVLNKGTYKGYQGFVSDFFPATYQLTTTGKTYVEADKYGDIMDIDTKFVSDFGESKVERFIPYTYETNVVTVIYRVPESNELRVGVVIENQNVILQSLQMQGYSMQEINDFFENKNNKFVIELSVFDPSFILNISDLNIGTGISNALVEKLNNMHLEDNSQQAPIQLLEQFAEEIKTNSSLLDKITYPERYIIAAEITAGLHRQAQAQGEPETVRRFKLQTLRAQRTDRIQEMLVPSSTEVKIVPVFKANIVGPIYYMNVSDNLGEFSEYNPNKNQYYISYNRLLSFKPSMLRIDPVDKRYAFVKKGEFSKIRFKIKNYTPARLTVTLNSMGRTINSHVVQVRDKSGNLVFKSTPVYPADVFYMDILLKNGNTAQVNKMLENDQLEVLEKNDSQSTYIKRSISKDEIKSLEPGFSFHEDGQMQARSSDNLGELLFNTEQPLEEEQVQVYDEEEDLDSKEYDGYDGEIVEGIEELEEPKASFKDTQRTSVEHVEMTPKQKKLKDEITNVLNRLGLHDEVIDIYATMNNVEELIKIVINRLRVIDYEQDILVTNNIKFIIVCLILYDIIKQGIRENLDNVIHKLYPGYFSLGDINAASLNDNIFLKSSWNASLTQDIINQAFNNINVYRQNVDMYPEIVKTILLNCDLALQNILGTRYNINLSTHIQTLLPVGVNPVTGRRLKEERDEAAMEKARRGFKQLSISVDDILNNRIPENEVKIMWSDYLEILSNFQQVLQEKFNNQGNKNYLYIKDNLYRAPFALRDNNLLVEQDSEKVFIPIPSNVKKAFETTYKTLLAHIIKHNLNKERLKARKRKSDEELLERRSRLIKPSNEELFGDEDEPVHTRAFLKAQGLRKMRDSIAEGTRAANRNAYREKRERTQEDANKETK